MLLAHILMLYFSPISNLWTDNLWTDDRHTADRQTTALTSLSEDRRPSHRSLVSTVWQFDGSSHCWPCILTALHTDGYSHRRPFFLTARVLTLTALHIPPLRRSASSYSTEFARCARQTAPPPPHHRSVVSTRMRKQMYTQILVLFCCATSKP